MKKILLSLLIAVVIFTASCSKKESPVSDWDTYIKEHKEWQHSRLERLKSENGWLNLAGLLWLEEGENTFGSDSSNDIVFPATFPPFGGSIELQDSLCTLGADPSAGLQINGKAATGKVMLRNDQQKDKTVMEAGSFRWFIIKRGEQYAIRLRDLNHPRIQKLDHIPSYAFSKDWVVESHLHLFDTVKTIEVPTVIPGYSEFYKAPGELKFEIKGKKLSLIPFSSGNGFFMIVGDATNGIDTYGAGRFLHVDRIEGDRVIIDFNKAYNPPCAFSPFATCPLPPPENILSIPIEAGEKAVHME